MRNTLRAFVGTSSSRAKEIIRSHKTLYRMARSAKKYLHNAPKKHTKSDSHYSPLDSSVMILNKVLAPDLPFLYMYEKRPSPKHMIVFMPSALKAGSERQKPIFSRWTWRDSFPKADVMAFMDPVTLLPYEECELNGAWFIHPKYDLLKLLTDLVKEECKRRCIPDHHVIYYGSSLGGFSALCAASLHKGSSAVAEVPQIELKDWRETPVNKVIKYVMKEPYDDFRAKYPERVSVQERMMKTGNIPDFTILTNATEFLLDSQKEFVKWCRERAPQKDIDIVISTTRTGHQVATRAEVVDAIHRFLR